MKDVCNKHDIINEKKLCFMYAGQGTQYYGMARALYNKNVVFRNTMDKMDKVIINTFGYSVIAELYSNNKTLSDRFKSIIYTHPAIYMIEYSLTQTLIESGLIPSILIGSSLGEMVALAVAGYVTPETMLEFICLHALLIYDVCHLGGMIAVLGNRKIFDEMTSLGIITEMAAIIHDGHFIISGECINIDMAEQYLLSKKITHSRLPIEYGFHSKNLDPIKSDFIELARNIKHGRRGIPVYSSTEIEEFQVITEQILWMIIRDTFDLRRAINRISDLQNVVLIDVGPSGMFSNCAKVILNRKDSIYSIISPFNTEERCLDQIINEYYPARKAQML